MTERCKALNQWRKPREESAARQPWWMGRVAVLERLYAMAAPLFVPVEDGRGEAWANTAICGPGDAVGVKLGAGPVERTSVNVGSDSTLPFPHDSWSCGGQAQRPLWASGRGGAVVVLRGRESRPHGEGRQRVEQLGWWQGGRR
jgi:hypothetical protein